MGAKTKSPVATRDISERDNFLLGSQPLASQLPYCFPNGFKLTDISTRCADCNAVLEGKHLRGVLSVQSESEVSCELIGICTTCRLGTNVVVRVDDTGGMRSLEGGRWIKGHRTLRSQIDGFFYRVKVTLIENIQNVYQWIMK